MVLLIRTMQNLKNFRIGEAFYFLENNKGSKVRININYAKDAYELLPLADNGDMDLLEKQASVAARHMMGKKAKKNLVEKLLQLDLSK